jgi:O-antigen ligase
LLALIGMGWLVVQPWGPVVALALAGLILFSVALVTRAAATWWGVFVLSLGGALVLGYGFANLGLPTSPPLPLAEMALVFLLVGGVISQRRPIPRAVFVPVVIFVGYATFRLIWDAPTWGQSAARDYTLPLEGLFLFVGYWAMGRLGVDRWVRALRWIFLLALAYFLLYPFQEALRALSFPVGLQHPVTLFGQFAGSGPAAASGMFFFAIVRPNRRAYFIAGAFVAVMLLFQARALYIAVPLAGLIIAVLAGRRGPGRRLALTLVFAVAIGTATIAASPPGRLGDVSPEFYASHVRTLFGSSGPGAGSYQHRLLLYEHAISEVQEQPLGWLVGVGLGPDLTVGFDEREVRKPHNDFLEVYARMGVLGLLPFLWLLAACFWFTLRGAQRATGIESRFLWWVVATTIVYLFVASVQPLLAFPYGTIPLFSSLGAGLALAQESIRTSRRRRGGTARHLRR